MQTERKPVLKKRPSGKFKMAPFQREDIARLVEYDSSANWSEMGSFKTTTAEWLWQQKLAHIPNPRVLVITTKTGKGTYFESLAEVLPDWDVFTVETKRTRMVLGSRPVPFNIELPTPLHFRPIVVVAHYHCFTNRACIPQQKKQPAVDPFTGEPKMIDGKPLMVPVINENGTFEMEIPRCYQLLNREWDLVVVDEAHRIKNPDAQWTVNIKKLKSQYKHIMTGTGFVNNPSEIQSLLNFLYPKIYTSRDKFKKHFCQVEIGYDGYQRITGIKPEAEEEFRGLVRRVGVRRTMLECFPNIKEPMETVVEVDLNAKQRKMYDEMLNYLRTLDAKGEPLHSPNVLSMLNRLRQISAATPNVTKDEYNELEDRRIIEVELVEPSSKLDAIMEILEGLEWDKDKKDQIVVFSNYKGTLKLLEARLEKAKIPYLRLLAEMNERDRYEMWHDTWPKKEHQVFLTTLALGSESINLSAANRAIFIDQAWSPAMNKQAIGRVYRPGQTQPVQLIYIRANNTVDYRVLDAVDTKLGWFRQIFHNDVENDETDTDNES